MTILHKRLLHGALLTSYLIVGIISPASSLADESNIEISCGIMTAHFDGGIDKSVNGFFVRNGHEVYFVTVLHVTKIFGAITQSHPNEVSIFAPGLKQIIKIPYSRKIFHDGDSDAVKDDGETVDILAIDLTDLLRDPANAGYIDKMITYEMLVRDVSSESNLNMYLSGYAASEMGIGQNYIEQTTIADLNTFGRPVRIAPNENPSGFWFNTRTYHGDCGRPLYSISDISKDIHIYGLVKTFDLNSERSFANDSTAIIRTIDRLRYTDPT